MFKYKVPLNKMTKFDNKLQIHEKIRNNLLLISGEHTIL